MRNRYRILIVNRYRICEPLVHSEKFQWVQKCSSIGTGDNAMQDVMFGLHTGEMHRWISSREAVAIRDYFGLGPDANLEGEMAFYANGITKLWIDEVPGKSKPRNYLHLRVNFSRAIGGSNYLVMPYTVANARKAIKGISLILKKIGLINGNEDFGDWTVSRLDSALDFQDANADLTMRLLKLSVDLHDTRKKCNLILPQEMSIKFDSLRFGNQSYQFNIYRKIVELTNKGKTIDAITAADIENLLRVERQNHESALKRLLPSMKVKDLTEPTVREKILKVMTDDLHGFFGEGDFYSYSNLIETFKDFKDDLQTVLATMKHYSTHSLMESGVIYSPEIESIFRKLKISPVGIRRQDSESYKIGTIQGLYNRVIAQYPPPPEKRCYHSFPIPHATADGRVKATITFYQARAGARQLSIAGRTIEDYERKVFHRLSDIYLRNRTCLRSKDANERKMVLKSLDSIIRFREVVCTAKIKDEIDNFVTAFETHDRSVLDSFDDVQ